MADNISKKAVDIFKKLYPNLAYHVGLSDKMPDANMNEVLSGDPGSAPTHIAGLVMNPKNAKIIGSRVAEYMASNSGKKLDAVDLAIAYLKAKYPKLAGIPSEISSKKLSYTLNGQFRPKENIVELNSSVHKTLNTAVQAGAHEITHAFQQFKDPDTYKNYIDSRLNFGALFDQYKAQPTEVAARQAGATAKATFEKYLGLLKVK